MSHLAVAVTNKQRPLVYITTATATKISLFDTFIKAESLSAYVFSYMLGNGHG